MEFDAVYKEYWQRIYRLCMGYVNDIQWAQDIAQDTFVKVWEQLPNFRNESAIGTWIYRIAVNNCLRQIERKRRFPRAALEMDIPREEPENMETEVQLLYRFIAALPEIDRIIIGLELEEIAQGDIAEIIGLSESNVRVRIHRIKKKLFNQFSDYES
jgi:RNA polymerase sigma-70 factor (ECF subfamily)